jgi:hypothetical protein
LASFEVAPEVLSADLEKFIPEIHRFTSQKWEAKAASA